MTRALLSSPQMLRCRPSVSLALSEASLACGVRVRSVALSMRRPQVCPLQCSAPLLFSSVLWALLCFACGGWWWW
jgi:hypothetical protein